MLALSHFVVAALACVVALATAQVIALSPPIIDTTMVAKATTLRSQSLSSSPTSWCEYGRCYTLAKEECLSDQVCAWGPAHTCEGDPCISALSHLECNWDPRCTWDSGTCVSACVHHGASREECETFRECKYSDSSVYSACILKSYRNATCNRFKSPETCLADFCQWDYYINQCRKSGIDERTCYPKNFSECIDSPKCLWMSSYDGFTHDRCVDDHCATLGYSRCIKASYYCAYNRTTRKCRNICAQNSPESCLEQPKCEWVEPSHNTGFCRKGSCGSLSNTNYSACRDSPLLCVWDPTSKTCSQDACAIASEQICQSFSLNNRQCHWSSTTNRCQDACSVTTREACASATNTSQCEWSQTEGVCYFVPGPVLCANRTNPESCSSTSICKWTMEGCVYDTLCSPLKVLQSCVKESECMWDDFKGLCTSMCGALHDQKACIATMTCVWAQKFSSKFTIVLIVCCIAGCCFLGFISAAAVYTYYYFIKHKRPQLGYRLIHGEASGTDSDLFEPSLDQTRTANATTD